MGKPSPVVKAKLQERWPHLFTFPVPLKVGIHLDYKALDDRPVGMWKFCRFIETWCDQPAYKRAVNEAKARYGFDGGMYPVRPWENQDGR